MYGPTAARVFCKIIESVSKIVTVANGCETDVILWISVENYKQGMSKSELLAVHLAFMMKRAIGSLKE